MCWEWLGGWDGLCQQKRGRLEVWKIPCKPANILASRQLESSGRGAVWLARYTGGVEVAGSNPVAPTVKTML